MSDVPPPGAAPGAGGSDGPGGGHNWLPKYMQRSRTPGPAANADDNEDGEVPRPLLQIPPSPKYNRVFKLKTSKLGAGSGRSVSDGVLTRKTATNDGGDDLLTPPTPTSAAKRLRDKEREKEWERLEAQWEKEQYEQRYQHRFSSSADRSSDNSGYTASASSQARAGITISSLLSLAQRGKGSTPLVAPLVPSGVDPRTPADNAWRIHEIASGPGILGGPSPVGQDRFPKAQPRTSAAEPWHNPNLLQQIETLQCAMMKKKDPMEQIPAVYNSCVLVMIEAYGKMMTRCKTFDSQIAEMNQAREKEVKEMEQTRIKELEQFQGLSEEWIQRENNYKAEIKRLELVLAKESKDGVASVAVARSSSLVDRLGTKRFQARLRRMSGSNQEGMDDETVKEEPESLDAPRTTTYYRTLADIPQCFDADKDAQMSRVVEKREKEDKQRRELEAFMEPRVGVRNTYKDATGYQKQISSRHAGQQVTKVEQDKLREAQTLGPIPELKGLADAALNDIDDGLTVGREGNRSDTTVTTGSKQAAKYEPISGLSAIRREAAGIKGYNEEPTQSGHGRGRRYSFSRGDDDVLPVTSALTASFKEAEPRRAAGVPTSTPSMAGLEDTFGKDAGCKLTGLPLSTSTDSTGSVVWLGGSGTLGAGNPDHQSGYTNSPSRGAKDGSHKANVSASVFTTEQARGRPQDPEPFGSVVYSPMRLTETLGARYARDGAVSSSVAYPSVSAMAASNPDTCQDIESSVRGINVASPPPAFAPASTTTPSGALSGLSPSRVTAKTSKTASGKAVTEDGDRS